MKTCKRCKLDKKHFYRDCDRFDGRDLICAECRRAEKKDRNRVRPKGSCGDCGAPCELKARRCKACFEALNRAEARDDAFDALAKVDARLESAGRCGHCHLLLPCGGHVTAAFYAHLSREVA